MNPSGVDARLARSFYDCDGKRRWARRAGLRQISQILASGKRNIADGVADCQTVSCGAREVEIQLSASKSGSCVTSVKAQTESGEHLPLSWDAATANNRLLPVEFDAPLETGYVTARLVLADGSGKSSCCQFLLLVAPQTCHRLEAGPQAQVLSAQLYALPSPRDWGIGDFSDLFSLCRSARSRGYAYVMLNPLHLIFFEKIETVSPYSPQSRVLLNWIYVDVEKVPGFDAIAPDLAPSSCEQKNAAETIDYAAAAVRKRRALTALARYFETPAARAELAPTVRSYEAFTWNWRETITALVRAGLQGSPDPEILFEIEFQLFAQWCADSQLAAVVEDPECADLILDLAIGVASDAAEAKTDGSCFVPDATLGVPPDPFGPKGQNWQLAPFHPDALRARGYDPLKQILRANMPVGGGIRIDHVMWALRQFWIPRGRSCAEGVYVEFPLDEILAVIRIESARRRCIVIGEDLGTVPRGFRAKLRTAGLYTMSVVPFEYDARGARKPFGRYPDDSALFLRTHDLPTLRAYWGMRGLKLRRALGLCAPEQYLAACRARKTGLASLAALFQVTPCLAEEDWDAFLARLIEKARSAPCALRIDMLDDLLGDEQPLNVPGTIDEYPNWRTRYSGTLESSL